MIRAGMALREKQPEEKDPMNKSELKEELYREIDRRKEELIELGIQLWKNPEPGYEEFKSAALVEKVLSSLNLPVRGKTGTDRCPRRPQDRQTGPDRRHSRRTRRPHHAGTSGSRPANPRRTRLRT